MPAVVRSISKQLLTKIASSTSNSDETLRSKSSTGLASNNKAIDDVPLNQTVVKSSKCTSRTHKPSAKRVPTLPATVIGNKDLKLKVSHNDAGRVVISLSNPDRVLLQVHVDESVLRTKGGVLKKKTKMATSSKKEDKHRPKKRSNPTAKSSKKTSSTSTSAKKHSSKKNEPRDLPDEQSVRGERSKSRRSDGSSRKPAVRVTEASHISSAMSIASSIISDDDSTRSPKDLNRMVPKTPRVQKALDCHGNTPSIEPDEFAATPKWDKRRQQMIKRQNSKDLDNPPGAHSSKAELHDHMQNKIAEAKMEESADDLSVFSSPFQQRRLQHRQKRLERQKSGEMDSTYRSTRSIRSTEGATPAPSRVPLDPPSIELDVMSNQTPVSFPPVHTTKADHQSQGSSSHNREIHKRQFPHIDPDQEDESVNNNNNRRINKTIEEARKVELKNEGDYRSGRSSYRKKNDEEDEMDAKLLAAGASKTGSNIFTKLKDKVCDKVCNTGKRQRKDHQKLG